MLNIYKRVEKSLDNLSGIVEIQRVEELERPFLLCLSAQDNYDKSIYGIIKKGAQAARVYTSEEAAAGFKIDNMPADFLGLRFRSDNVYTNNYEEIVNKLIYPFLIIYGLSQIEKIKWQARKINLMTYCDGTLTYKKIEEELEKKFKNDALSQDVIDSILSQISLVAIGTMIDISDFKATTAFVDVNDTEISTDMTNRYKKMLQDKGCQSIYGTLKKNVLYIYNGTGNHSLKEYFLSDRIVKPALCSVLSHFLEISIESQRQGSLIGISASNSLSQLAKYTKKMASRELLALLDRNVNYASPKYNTEEASMRHELDLLCKRVREQETQLRTFQEREENMQQQIAKIIEGLKEYSSQETMSQILTFSGLYQPSLKANPFQELSDKSVRELYNSYHQVKGSRPKS